MGARPTAVADWVSVRAAADQIGVSSQTVHRMIHMGELDASQLLTEAGHRRTIVARGSVEAARARRQATGPQAA